MPNTLTKADIIEAIQKENGYSRKQSSEITEILLEIIKQSLESGEDVMISGFGMTSCIMSEGITLTSSLIRAVG